MNEEPPNVSTGPLTPALMQERIDQLEFDKRLLLRALAESTAARQDMKLELAGVCELNRKVKAEYRQYRGEDTSRRDSLQECEQKYRAAAAQSTELKTLLRQAENLLHHYARKSPKLKELARKIKFECANL